MLQFFPVIKPFWRQLETGSHSFMYTTAVQNSPHKKTLLFLHQMIERKLLLKVEGEILTPSYLFAKYEFASTEPECPPTKDLALANSEMSKLQIRRASYGNFGSPLCILKPRTIVTHDMRLLSCLCLYPSDF